MTRYPNFDQLETRLVLAADLPALAIASENGFVLEVAGEEFVEIHEVGDINGDGFDDVAVSGQQLIEPSQTLVGSTYVVFGTPNVAVEPVQFSTVPPISKESFRVRGQVDGTNAFALAGYGLEDTSVAALGDVNGDGLDDLGLLHRSADSELFVDVLFGSTEPFDPVVRLVDNRDSGFSILANDAINPALGGRGGIGSGDFNNDGFSDIVVGGSSVLGVWVLYGSDSLPTQMELFDVDGETGFHFDLIENNNYRFVDAADFNGDGFDDLLVGAFHGTELYVIYGAADSPETITPDDLDGTNGFIIEHTNADKLVGLGDINADGRDDIAIAAESRNRELQIIFGMDETSRILKTNQLTADQGYVVQGVRSLFSGPSLSVTGPGDVNGDGIDDLLLGNPSYSPILEEPSGEVYLVYGGTSIVRDLSELTPETGFGFVGYMQFEVGDALGARVQELGDFNGDGIDDLFFRSAASNGDDRAYVVYGKPSTLPGDANGDGSTNFQDFLILANNFGKEGAVFADGDFDGDGRVSFLDFLVLAENFGKSIA